MTEDYKPNSHLAREQKSAEHPPIPERRAQKVVTGEVSQRKKTGLSKAASTFLPGDVNSVKSYILMDVLVPSISCNYTDNKYGWTDLSSAQVERVRDGYVIRLPRATSL